MEEIWKDIKGYEGKYQISNLGRVKSMKRFDSKGCLRKERYLKPSMNNTGYWMTTLYKNGISKFCSIHRLVAEAFIPNPDNLPCVNHKDENPKNNYVDNLEWCTIKYNVNYGTANTKRQLTNMDKKPVRCIETGMTYIGAKEAERQTGINRNTIIRKCNNPKIIKKIRLHYEFVDKDNVNAGLSNTPKQVRCIETGIIYNSIKEAAKENNIGAKTVSYDCNYKTYKSVKPKIYTFHWEYVDKE